MEAHAVTLLNSILSSHAGDVVHLEPVVWEILQFLDAQRWLKLGTLCITEPCERDAPMEYLISLFDEVLFNGAVGTITFVWEPHLVTELNALGLCRGNSYGETLIVVDPEPPFESVEAKAMSVIGTLLHECVHAVFRKACHRGTPHEHPDCGIHIGLTGHGPVWVSLAQAVERRARRLIWPELDIQLCVAESEMIENVSYSLACTLISIALEPSMTTGAQPRQSARNTWTGSSLATSVLPPPPSLCFGNHCALHGTIVPVRHVVPIPNCQATTGTLSPQPVPWYLSVDSAYTMLLWSRP